MDFGEIIGHDRMKFEISKAIDMKRFSHAHIIVGEDGIGKSIIAREIADNLVENKNKGQHADIIEYRLKKKKKSIGIDDIKNIIEETVKKPYQGNRKVIIVYKADLITEAAQNAFLKTIEEPFPGVYIILLCEKLDSILDTIQSRCEVHKLSRLKNSQIIEFLDEKFPDMPQEKRKAVVAFSDGIPGRAEKFIQDSSLDEIRNTILELLRALKNTQVDIIYGYSSFLFRHREDWREIFTCILSYIRDIFIYKETGSKGMIINSDKFNDIKILGEIFSFSKLNCIIDIVNKAEKKLERNVNQSLVFDSMLLKMQEV